MKEKTKKPFYKKWWFIVIILLVIIGAFMQPSDEEKAEMEAEETTVEEKSETEAKETTAEGKNEVEKAPAEVDSNNNDSSEKDIYTKNVKPTIDDVMKQYDAIWNEHWKPVWTEISASQNPDLQSLSTEMTAITDKYGQLNEKIINLKNTGLSDENKELIEDFRVNMGLALSYRANAGTAITQAINGSADLESRMEEALKSVELSDEKLISAIASMVTLEQNLGIER